MDNPIQKLCSLEFFGIKLGLQNLSVLLKLIGNPQDNLKFIHIAGTNGKGSVCSILSKVLVRAGFRVGLFTSPHLVTIRERFRFNNCAIREDELNSIISEIWSYIDELYKKDFKITFFEATVAIALLFFERKKCDFVVWETGMGGRLDGTNIVDPIITAITTINYDHQKYLGDTLEKIAFEKAGIIKKGIPLFLGNIQKFPLNVIVKRAQEFNSKIYAYNPNLLNFTDMADNLSFSLSDSSDKRNYQLSLSGEYQKHNMILAYSILQYLSQSYNFDLSKALMALNQLKWHARCQMLPDGKILDGAHNMEGIEALLSSMKIKYPNEKFTIIFGCLEERNPGNAISALSSIAEKFIFAPIISSRKTFLPVKIIELMRDRKGFNIDCIAAESARHALSLAANSKVLITGSLYLAGEILREYYSEDYITNI